MYCVDSTIKLNAICSPFFARESNGTHIKHSAFFIHLPVVRALHIRLNGVLVMCAHVETTINYVNSFFKYIFFYSLFSILQHLFKWCETFAFKIDVVAYCHWYYCCSYANNGNRDQPKKKWPYNLFKRSSDSNCTCVRLAGYVSVCATAKTATARH